MLNLPKPDTPVFLESSDCALARSISNHAIELRLGSLVILSEVLLCSCFDRKVHQHILVTLLGNRSSLAMTHYGMEIYNNNTIMASIYANLVVQYINYLPTPPAYDTNVVDRSHVVITVSSSHVNMNDSYSSTDLSRSNHNVYVFEHASNMHNGFVPPYSLTELVSHCTSQSHTPMSNCYYSQDDMRASVNFDQSLYTPLDLIIMEIASNMVSSQPVVSSMFHSASPIYSRVEESSANTPASITNRSNIDKGPDTNEGSKL
jgi:hypothetical protein